MGSIPSRSRHGAAPGETEAAPGGGRPRNGRPRSLGVARSIVVGIAGAAFVTSVLSAQVRTDTTRRVAPPVDTTRGPARQQRGVPPAPRDSARPPISPGRAFLYSFALPGLGQARLDRHAAGAIYMTVEALAVGLAAKAANDLRIAKDHERDIVINRYQIDPVTGEPTVTAKGNFIPEDTVHNRNVSLRVKARRTHFEDWIAALIFNHLFAGADAFVAAHLWDLPAHVGFRAVPHGPALGVTIRW